MKTKFVCSFAVVIFSIIGNFGHAQEENLDQVVAYQCPAGWHAINRGEVYCQNPRTGALLIRQSTGEVISVYEGKHEKGSCTWHVIGIFAGCN
jgi:hypothetical protein